MCYSVLIWTVDDVINVKNIFDQSLKQLLTGGKEGKTEIQKPEYLEKEKSLLDEIKNLFHKF